MARRLRPCGTVAAYSRHLRRGEEPCQPCRTANTAYQREYKANPKPPRPLMPCGTAAAYARHIRNDEEPCAPCREAHSVRQRTNERAKAKGRARQRALGRLSVLYGEAYESLLAEEEAKEGLS